MDRIGVRTFRDKATHYLRLGKPIAIERHGEVVGYYLPVKKHSPEKVEHRLAALEAIIHQLTSETDMNEDDLADALALSKKL